MKEMMGRVVIATDGSEGSMEAIRFAASLLDASRARVVLLHVIPTTTIPLGTTSLHPDDKVEVEKTMWEGGQAILSRGAAPLEGAGIPVEGRLARGQAADEILEVARQENAVLVVLSSHGEGGAEERDLGSTSEAVVKSAHCPVLVVRK